MEPILAKAQYEYYTKIHTWYVIFDKQRTQREWFSYITGRKWAHVYLARSTEEGSVLVVNPLNWGIVVETYPNMKIEDYLIGFADSTAILSYTADYRRNVDRVTHGLYSCVNVVKQVLGLRFCWAITPFQLYRHLCKHKTTIMVKPYVPYLQNQTP